LDAVVAGVVEGEKAVASVTVTVGSAVDVGVSVSRCATVGLDGIVFVVAVAVATDVGVSVMVLVGVGCNATAGEAVVGVVAAVDDTLPFEQAPATTSNVRQTVIRVLIVCCR
jgi:hypothetical protein